MRLYSFLILATSVACATAQPRVTTPVLGYAYDPGLHAIRSIMGTPGAAVLGGPLRLSFRPRMVAIAPPQTYALAVSTSGEVILADWSGSASERSLQGSMRGPDRLIFSPSGTAALLYSSSSAQMQAVAGLPDAPVMREIQAAGSAAVTAMAIADDATVVLAAGGRAYTIGADLNAVPLPLPATIQALAFRGSTHDLVAVTPAGDVYLAGNVAGNLDLRTVAAGSPATQDPVAVAVSPDGSAAFLAGRDGTLSSIDLNTGAASSTSCRCSPTGLQPLGRESLFRLTDISENPVWLFDASPSHNPLWFIPAQAQRSAQ